MQKQGMKEIRLEIRNEFIMNMMNYFMTQEGYLYVGNEKEIWLENLSHPTVQLIYFNQVPIYNEMQEQSLLKLITRVRSRVRQRYLLMRLNVLVIQVAQAPSYELSLDKSYLKLIMAKDAHDLHQDEEVMAIYPALAHVTLDRSMPELILELHHVSKEKAQHVQKALSYQKYPIVTGLFILICALIFVFISFQPEVNAATGVRFGAKYNPLIVAGDYFRLLTPAIIHLGVFHLLMNSVFIYQFGKLIEQSFGWWRTAAIMLGAAVIGNLFSFAFSTTISLGASTVAYGLIGAILFLGLENRKMFMHLVRGLVFPILAFSLLWGVLDQSIDLYGHLGGFLGGFLVASIVGNPHYKQHWQRIALAVATLVFLISGMWIKGVRLTEETDFKDVNLAIAYYYLQYTDSDTTLKLMNQLDIK